MLGGLLSSADADGAPRVRRADPGFTDAQVEGPFDALGAHARMEPAAMAPACWWTRSTTSCHWARWATSAGAGMWSGSSSSSSTSGMPARRLDLLRHAAFADQPRRTVAITGGTGMIGSALTWLAFAPEDTRSGGSRATPMHHAVTSAGIPAQAGSTQRSWLGVDAVVHLAGASVGERWTAPHKREILESRERGTRTLVEALKRMPTPPEVLISGSAIGYYGDTGSILIDESTGKGAGYPCRRLRCLGARGAGVAAAGIRSHVARTGVVLSAAGGALAKMLPAFRADSADRSAPAING